MTEIESAIALLESAGYRVIQPGAARIPRTHGAGWKDMTGQRFTRLLVKAPAHVERHGKSSTQFWHCLCDCGTEVVASGKRLRNGSTKSCGCYKTDVVRVANAEHARAGRIGWGARHAKRRAATS